MTALLDANVLIALLFADHIHHERATDWLESTEGGHATCPITQGAVLRFGVRGGLSCGETLQALRDHLADPRHEFWPDAIGYDSVRVDGVIGHRQVTDAYLAGLARHHAGQLATIDAGLAALHSDVALVLPELPAP